ncbi:MAG TPA: hypothetical protein VN838_12095 [Bradyrhizobium sp.]|nr:hypothetical protein [Bradyrhizobium sp.]
MTDRDAAIRQILDQGTMQELKDALFEATQENADLRRAVVGCKAEIARLKADVAGLRWAAVTYMKAAHWMLSKFPPEKTK